MHRSTIWRHKTKRSKVYRTKTQPIDYFKLSLSVAKRYFPGLFQYKEDVVQECRLLEALCNRNNSWKNNFESGNQRGKVGIKRASRLFYRHFTQMSANYGFYRPKYGKAFISRPQTWLDTDGGIDESRLYDWRQSQEFENIDFWQSLKFYLFQKEWEEVENFILKDKKLSIPVKNRIKTILIA